MYSQQKFSADRHGTEYMAVIIVGSPIGEQVLQVVFNWRSGFGGGSRRLASQILGDEAWIRVVAGLSGEMPRWALADVLQELGIDDGVTQTVRG